MYGEYGNTSCGVSTLRLQNPINFYLNPPKIEIENQEFQFFEMFQSKHFQKSKIDLRR